MEKQLIYKDENKIISLTNEINEKADFFQELLTPVIEANLTDNFVLNTNDLDVLLRKPKEFIAGILVPQNTQIAGLNINREKMFDLLELPNNVKGIISNIESLKMFESINWNNYGRFLQHLEIAENVVKPKQKYITEIEDSNCVYIETEQQKAVFEALANMQKEMKTIISYLPYTSIFSIKLLKDVYLIENNEIGNPSNGNEVFAINHDFIKTI